MDRALGLLAFFVFLLVVGFEVYWHIRHWFEDDDSRSAAGRDHSLLGDALRDEKPAPGPEGRPPAEGADADESRHH